MRVFLIDDHALFRAGLESLLERQGIEVVGYSRDGVTNLDLLPTLRVDVILLDMRLGDTNGTQVIEHLNNSGIAIPVVVLTTSRDQRDLLDSLRLGARGYLLKDMEPKQLIDALHRVVRGETAIAPELTGILAHALQPINPNEETGESKSPPPAFSDLTPRERQILEHLAQGQSNKLMARHLGISEGTVKLHVKAVLRKLGLRSRVEAAVLAVEQGIGHSHMADASNKRDQA